MLFILQRSLKRHNDAAVCVDEPSSMSEEPLFHNINSDKCIHFASID